MTDILKNDTFHFYIPLHKSADATDDKRLIEGIASTEDADLQAEKVIQKGIDITYFVKHGNLNWDHKSEPQYVIGEPLECTQTLQGLYVKGLLYKNHKVADGVWELANAMEKSGGTRRLGFSIQGKVLRRQDGGSVKTIEACWLQAIAVTANPINTHTFLDIVKALNEETWCDERTGVCYDIKSIPTVPTMHKVVEEKKSLTRCSCDAGKSDALLDYEDAINFVEKNYGFSRDVAKALANSAFLMNNLEES